LSPFRQSYKSGEIASYFDSACRLHGRSVYSVGWYSEETQRKRFQQLAKSILPGELILDIGCGLGDFYGYLKSELSDFSYFGIDLSPKMVGFAKQKYPEGHFVVADLFSFPLQEKFDVVVASGAFNYVQANPEVYLQAAMKAMCDLAEKRVIFNLLDVDKMSEDRSGILAGYSPSVVAAWATHLSDRVFLFQDYLPNDFTVCIELESQ